MNRYVTIKNKPKSKPKHFIAFCLTLLLSIYGLRGTASAQTSDPYASQSTGATAQMKDLADQILSILQDPSCKADQSGCRQKLRDLIKAHWDTVEMARSALGVHWRELSEDQRQDFTKLFANLTESIYITRANLSKAQNTANGGVQVEFLREIPEGEGYAQVNSRVTLKQGQQPVSVSYRVKLMNGQWMVYDVIVADISLDGNYRNQFSRVINQKGYPELVRLLQQKVQQAEAAESTSAGS